MDYKVKYNELQEQVLISQLVNMLKIIYILMQISKNTNNFIIQNINMVEKECAHNKQIISIEVNEVL